MRWWHTAYLLMFTYRADYIYAVWTEGLGCCMPQRPMSRGRVLCPYSPWHAPNLVWMACQSKPLGCGDEAVPPGCTAPRGAWMVCAC